MTQQFGLHDAGFERASCGVGFVVNIQGKRSHAIVEDGLRVLDNLMHRGATGADPNTGDGAGILLQIPDGFFREVLDAEGIALPSSRDYAVGVVFLPTRTSSRLLIEGLIERIAEEEGLEVLGWRDVPTNNKAIGEHALDVEPVIKQVFLRRGQAIQPGMAFERKLYVVRKRLECTVREMDAGDLSRFHVPSLSSRTIVYKGLLLAPQIAEYYPDLRDGRLESALALVHQRYSTNTFPTWDLAQPFRFLAHNGEINTIRGNRNWMHARESTLKSPLFGNDIQKLLPIVTPGGSDSASFDNVLELLVMAGRPLAHAVMMMIPEAWDQDPRMDDPKRAFYEFHAPLMEPWDGPAAIAFCDGELIGATLDRNGLRPARYLVTADGRVVLASEAGVLDISPDNVTLKGRLAPGKMLLIDTSQGRIVNDEELKAEIAGKAPYKERIKKKIVDLAAIAPKGASRPEEEWDERTLISHQLVFGYTLEDEKVVMGPMARTGTEPTGSMGNDTALSILSGKPKLLFTYFKQLFAQVTNPAIDPIREEVVMSLFGYLGRAGNLLDPEARTTRVLKLKTPILAHQDFEKVRYLDSEGLAATSLPTLFDVSRGGQGLQEALEELCETAKKRIRDGYNILVLSDRGVNASLAPIPSLLATGGLHHALVRSELRTQVGIVIESAEPREVAHFALLVGSGANAVYPYLAFELVRRMAREGKLADVGLTEEHSEKNYIKALNKGLLKVYSKMGISTHASYCGAQIFEAVGISKAVIDRYFTGTPSRVEGADLDIIAKETAVRHAMAFPETKRTLANLDDGGDYAYRRSGEFHMWNPKTITKLQEAVRNEDRVAFREFLQLADFAQDIQMVTLRSVMRFKDGRTRLPLEEVEPAESIVRRFVTSAMSFGSISKEAHESLAIAMNRLGSRSNSGEGGEDPERYKISSNGENRSSAVKQVASGRFGVTPEYLVNAKELQIKIAQGAKPGEGGQLPGYKVNEIIAKVRNTVPGITLISPPPHHDIYSIEDLKQLIYDLRNINPKATISVKLVAEAGVGTVAAGVAKAKADLILISGFEGGTGASPWSSIKHAGIPWEIGLAETHQVLVMNDLRSRVRLQTDGQLKTAKDVVVAALLGAEEFGFATLPLITLGCVMMRKCHLDTCPVGVATQNAKLREKFTGKPEYVVRYFLFLAEEVRVLMAGLGFRTMDEMVGRTDVLEPDPSLALHWKASGIDLMNILYRPIVPKRISIRKTKAQDTELETALDHKLIALARHSLETKSPVVIDMPVRNVHRTVGTMLGGEVVRRFGPEGLPEDTIQVRFVGTAGQSFGAFLPKGMTLFLEGDANDYLGKGLGGGRIVLFPPKQSSLTAGENIIAGNVLLYGASAGEVFISGKVGERFAIRNSGARAVVEGVGDHACEYMTGGTVVVLGETGRNFAAGMTGGVAYVWSPAGLDRRLFNATDVDLERLAVADCELIELLERHRLHTGSPRVGYILDNLDQELPRFIKLVPREYAKVLEGRKRKAADPEAVSLLTS